MSEQLGPLPREREVSRETGDTIEELQRQIAQRSGIIPHFPFTIGADGLEHELVEEDVRQHEQGER